MEDREPLEWELAWSRFGASWNYTWGKFTNPLLRPQVVFEPMQHNRWWEGRPEDLAADMAPFRASPKPVYLLGFNEPDRPDQANMSVTDVINLRPHFQNANLPLVSPVTSWATNGWLGDFCNQANARGYRVDFTAAHWYAYPGADNLIGYLENIFLTWGRPVWLTEFSNIDWANNQYWSEEDCYRFTSGANRNWNDSEAAAID